MPYFTQALPGVGGIIKGAPEDFVVEEIPAYAPSGEGQHLFLLVEKRGLTTQEMVRRLAAALDVDPREMGTAGQKDRMAVARQLVSVPDVDPVRAVHLKLDGIEVLSAARHGNKLRTGHLKGNRFTVVIRGIAQADALARARAVLQALSVSWLPNRFGAQRFGLRGDNIDKGKALLAGRIQVRDRFRRRFLISACQSLVFNRYLDLRTEEGLLHRVIEGEVLQRTQTGGLFVCQPTDMAYAQARLEARLIVPTGPMFGRSMFAPAPDSPAARREALALELEGLAAASFAGFGHLAEGTRRALLVRVEGAKVEPLGADALRLEFALPAGSYATVLLEEVMKPASPLTYAADL